MAMSDQKGSVLEQVLGRPIAVSGLVDYVKGSIVSKTVLDSPAGTITCFAFDKGQGLSEHTSPYHAVVHVIDGKAQITIQGRQMEVLQGQLVIMPAGQPHSVQAAVPFKMLLVMIRGHSHALCTQ